MDSGQSNFPPAPLPAMVIPPESRRGRILHICILCGAKFWGYSKGKYCSHLCQTKGWRRENPERWSQITKKGRIKFRTNNPDKYKETQRILRTNRRRHMLPSHPTRIANRFRQRVREILKRSKNLKLERTNRLVGCSWKQLKHHLESQFKDGMNWGNHATFGWHIDHIRPCASFNLSDPEQQKQCFHYTNLQPLWWIDNINKSNKLDWKP